MQFNGQKKNAKGQAMICKEVRRKLNIEQHKTH
jgi:bifunctional DNA-binding transcriptional regulator/antitoxin component of YhaV-PrlF toxin-antitoxin module